MLNIIKSCFILNVNMLPIIGAMFNSLTLAVRPAVTGSTAAGVRVDAILTRAAILTRHSSALINIIYKHVKIVESEIV